MGRFCWLVVLAPAEARPLAPTLAFGGRLFESSRWRGLTDALLLTSRPPRLVDAGAFAAPRPPKLPFAARFVPELFIERIGMCEAAEFGAVRATTARLCTEDGGTETRPRAF